MNPYNPKDIIKYLDDTSTQEEKDFLTSPEGKKKFEEFKKLWDEAHKELKDANIYSNRSCEWFRNSHS